MRREPDASLPELLARLVELGFDGVEPAGFFGRTPAAFRAACEAAGLAIPAVHQAIPLEEAARPHVEPLLDLGAPCVILPELDATHFARIETLQRLADSLHRVADAVNALGLDFGLHNHDWEFASRIGGQPAHRLLFERLEPRIGAEIDVYWTQVGGCDPVAEIEHLGRRARWLHLKDGPARDEQAPMTALGCGQVDLQAVRASSEAEWHIVEIDHCIGDVWDALATSMAFLGR